MKYQHRLPHEIDIDEAGKARSLREEAKKDIRLQEFNATNQKMIAACGLIADPKLASNHTFGSTLDYSIPECSQVYLTFHVPSTALNRTDISQVVRIQNAAQQEGDGDLPVIIITSARPELNEILLKGLYVAAIAIDQGLRGLSG